MSIYRSKGRNVLAHQVQILLSALPKCTTLVVPICSTEPSQNIDWAMLLKTRPEGELVDRWFFLVWFEHQI